MTVLLEEALSERGEAMDPEIESAWLVEIERRARAVANGTAVLVDWGTARARIEARLRERRAGRADR